MPFFHIQSLSFLRKVSCLLCCACFFSASETSAAPSVILTWGTQTSNENNTSLIWQGPSPAITNAGSPYQTLQELTGTGSTVGDIDGGLIELGFFDTDGTLDGGAYTPNTDASNPFSGIWTPITGKTTVGYDWGSGTDGNGLNLEVAAGYFYGTTKFENDDSTPNTSLNVGDSLSYEEASSSLTDDGIASATLNARIEALYDDTDGTYTTNPLIGIRFYNDAPASKVNGSQYNTIVNTNWRWAEFAEVGGEPNYYYTLYDYSGNLDTNSKFEFDNTAAYTLDVSKVGTGDARVANDDYVSTVTYYSGDGDYSATGSSHIFSGLTLGNSDIINIDNGHTYTLHANSGLDLNFSGALAKTSGTSGDAVIIKTGTGTQGLKGELRIEGANSKLDVYDGTLTLNPTTADTQIVEYITNTAGGTPTLKLDNTGVGSGEIVEIGLANTNTAQTYSGTVELSGSNGTTNKITVATGAADYSKEQVFSGGISGSNTLVKEGAGRLRLTGDSTTSFDGNVTVENGSLIIGDGSTNGTNLDSDNGITINKGKLEIAANESVTLTVSGGSGKSMIGGAGTITAATIGDDTGEIDYISPGRGISSSLTPSKKQVNHDANESSSIGNFTVGTLNWNSGGVYDWQIQDFDASGGTAGTDWDLLTFTTLNFESGQKFDINIMAINSTDGNQGAPDNLVNTWSGNYASTNGFLFMTGTTVNNLGTGDVTSSFNIRADDFYHPSNNWMGSWGVWRDGGNFYLTYSAVPEPSTYVMVTSLLMVPGMSYARRLRKRKAQADTIDEGAKSV